MSDLKRCPFCGQQLSTEVPQPSERWAVRRCNQCGAQNGVVSWNDRVDRPQWIACKERNPSERGSYLAVHNYGGVPQVRITNYGTSKKWDNGRNKLLPPEYRISHWMRLPEPPTC